MLGNKTLSVKECLKAGLLNTRATRLHLARKCSGTLPLVFIPRTCELWSCVSSTHLCTQDFPGFWGVVLQQSVAQTGMTGSLWWLVLRIEFLNKVLSSYIRSIMNG